MDKGVVQSEVKSSETEGKERRRKRAEAGRDLQALPEGWMTDQRPLALT